MNKIYIRNAGIEHSEMIWQWRNDPETLKMSFEERKIPLSEHKEWYKLALLDKRVTIFIAEENNNTVGVIRFDENPDDKKQYDISINICPKERGKGIGKILLIEGIKKLKYLKNESRIIIASVKKLNQKSRSLFKTCGFMKFSESDQIIKYKLELI